MLVLAPLLGEQVKDPLPTCMHFRNALLKHTHTHTLCRSAMFNILIIIALSAVLSGQALSLDWRPLARDSVVYGLSIIVFIGFAWDGKFQWYEALILLLLYVAYIVIMKFNSRLLDLLAKIECNWCRYNTMLNSSHFTCCYLH